MSVKSGIAPEVLRLPKGGGSINAISEGFTPDLKSGTGNYRIPLDVPEGRVPLPVELELVYSTGLGNGPLGLGWSLSGIPAIQRRLDLGIPTYTDVDLLEYTNVGELARVGTGRYRARVEEDFVAIQRNGDAFELRDREGRLFRFGESAGARIADPADPTRILRWFVSSIEDLNGNRTEFKYRRDDTPRDLLGGPANQLYLDQICYNNLPDGGFLYYINVAYDFDAPGEQRPDPILSFRAGFALETNWRARAIEIKLGQDSAAMHTFDTLPDGTPVGVFRPVQPNSFDPWGFQVYPLPPFTEINLGLFPSGSVFGADVPVLGLSSGQVIVIGELEILFLSAAVQRVTLTFFGANAIYTLRAYDDLDRLIAQAQVECVLFGEAQTISVDVPVASISRVEFGSPDGAFGITGIELLYQATPLCRRYEFTYDDGSPSRLSLLHSVQIFGEHPDGGLVSRPPILFGYSMPDPANRTLTPIVGAPSFSLSRDLFEVVDLVGTGTPDILYTAGANDHKYYLNRGAAKMAARVDMPTAPSTTLADMHTRLGDVKGLVAADLFNKDNVWPNPSIKPGRALSDPVEWGKQETVTSFPVFSPTQMPEVRFLDLTGDGRVDILYTGVKFRMWFQQPDHTFVQQPDIDRIPSYLEKDWPNVTFANPCIKLADMTGDGFMDIVRVDPLTARIDYWPNQGQGQWGKKRMMFFDGAGLNYPLSPQRMFFADIDNNGFADLIYIDSGHVYIWPNQGGKTFGPRERISNTPLVGSGVLDSVRLLDMTGCGTLGVLWTRDGAANEQTWQFINLTGEVKPNLLIRVENGTGGITEVEYASSAALYHAEERLGRGWAMTPPFAVHVVCKIRRTDLITGIVEETDYTYRDGYYDREKRQFQGFREVTVSHHGDATPTQEVRGAIDVHHFHQQRLDGLSAAQKADARTVAGREWLVEHFDQDGMTLLTWTRTDWKVMPVFRWHRGAPVAAESDQGDNTPVLFPYAHGRLGGAEEGTTGIKMKYEQEVRSLPNPLDTNPPEIAASHGQILELHLYGEVELRPLGDTTSATLTTVRRNATDTEVIDVPRDTRLIARSYAINESANLIRISRQVTTDAAGVIIAEHHYFYDGPDYQGLPAGNVSRGNLSRQTDLVLRVDRLAALYTGSTYNVDWAVLGYHTQALTDDSSDGLFVHAQRYRYGKFGLPDGTLSPMGQETTLVYDAYKTRLHQVTNPLNHTTLSTHDYRVGLPTTYTDENGRLWHYVYDGLGRVVKEIEPGDTEIFPTRSYEYREYEALNLGHPVAVIKNERETQRRPPVFSTYQYYDGFLRDLQVRKPWQTRRLRPIPSRSGGSFRPDRTPGYGSSLTDLRGRLSAQVTDYQVVSRTYNPRGGLAKETLPFLDVGSDYRPPGTTCPTRCFAYDALLRNARTTNPDGTVRLTERTPWTNTVFDEEDTSASSPHYDTPSTFQFNADENLNKVDRRIGTRLLSYQLDYDLLGNLIHAIDPTTNEIHWNFDTRGLLLKMVHPDAGTMLHYYNAAGQEVARLYANGDLIELTYDELQRIKTRKLGGPSLVTETFTYDTGEGPNLIGKLADVRDAAGTIAFGYDACGREVWQKRTYSDQPTQSYTTSLTYDSMGRFRRIDYPDGTNTLYRYGINGKVAQVDGLISRIIYHPSGQLSTLYYVGGSHQVITHDPVTHRVARRLVTVSELTYHDLAYAYDKVGNVITLTDAATAPGHLVMSRDYTYDDLYRLKSFASSQSHNESYDYDDIGNLTLHTGYSPYSLVYPATGQTSTLLGAQGETLWQYDANGRLIRGAGFDKLQWNAAQNLAKAIEFGGPTHEFVYSVDDEVVECIHTAPSGDSEIVRVPNKHFSVHSDKMIRRIYLDDMLVAVVRQMGGIETRVFMITNELGNVIGTIDEANSYNQIEYAPYGKRLHQTQAGVQYGFNSKEEVAPNLLSFDHRFLLASVGRWTQPDPLLLVNTKGIASRPERLNPYLYALNNPVKYIDPKGLAERKNDTLGIVKSFTTPLQAHESSYLQIDQEGDKLRRLLSGYLSDPRGVQFLQNRLQLPGPPGSIRGGEAAIWRNIEDRQRFKVTAKIGGMVLAIPVGFKLATGFQSMLGHDYEKAQESFAAVLMIPGGEKLVNNVLNWTLWDEAANQAEIAEGTVKLINNISLGMPNTINLLVDLGYELTGKGTTPESERFRMDFSVLWELQNFIDVE